MPRAILLIIAISLTLPTLVWATDYHVGPEESFANIGDVPWESLTAGDHVYIHARPTPYLEKWVINRVGTAENPITVTGVADQYGNLPIVHGEGATTRTQLNYWNEDRGIVKIGGSNSPPDGTPTYIVVEKIHFRRARGAFTGRYGSDTYLGNAAAVYVEKGDRITIRDCIVEDCGNGLFVASATTNVVIEGNHIYGNGNVGSIYEHNTYTEARNILYQFNRFGPLCDGCLGNNLKDRSSGTVIRYNWIESGNRQLDLVDAEGSMAIVNDPAYLETFVYGNVLIEPDGAGNSQIAHFGGDSGNTAIYRGTLYFWNNTIVSTRTTNTTLLRLSTNAQSADVRNNIVYVTASGDRLALSNSAGTLNYGWNLFKPGYVASHSTLTGEVVDIGGNVTAASPGFVGEAGQDYHLMVTSPARDAAGAFHSETSAHPLDREYLKHQSTLPRLTEGNLDIGAFEYPTAPLERTVSLAFLGNGSGTVTSDPVGIACDDDCSHLFDNNLQLTLHAEPKYSLFSGWSGNCSDAGDCLLTLDGDKSITATFAVDTEHRTRLGDSSSYFPTLQAAYDAAPNDSNVKVWGIEFQEELACGSDKEVAIEGGYDTGYSTQDGFTTLSGTLTVTLGSLEVDRLIVR